MEFQRRTQILEAMMPIARIEIPDDLLHLRLELSERRLERHEGFDDPEEQKFAQRERDTIAEIKAKLELRQKQTRNASREQ